MAKSKDFERLQEEYRTAGWTIKRTGGGHLRWTGPKGEGPIFTASTPSDHRAIQNVKAMLRRAARNPRST